MIVSGLCLHVIVSGLCLYVIVSGLCLHVIVSVLEFSLCDILGSKLKECIDEETVNYILGSTDFE